MSAKSNKRARILTCSARRPADGGFSLTCAAELQFAASEGDGASLPSFTMVAYTGAAMRFSEWSNPVVVDLDGLDITKQTIPIRAEHTMGVGHSTAIKRQGSKLLVAGVISRGTEAAREVVASSKNGFPWQSSIKAFATQVESFREGQVAEVNGKKFKGPIDVARKSSLIEISFVELGADGKTTATVAASAGVPKQKKETPVDFIAWLIENGFIQAGQTEADLPEGQARVLQAAFSARANQPVPAASPAPAASPVTAPAAAPIQAMRDETAAELDRLAQIRRVCGDRHMTIAAQAVRENWNLDRVNLQIERANRPTAPAAHSHGATAITPRLISAAIAQRANFRGVSQDYSPQELEAAHSMFRGRIGLHEILLTCAQRNGYIGMASVKANLREILQAAFSTADIAGILGAAANKSLLEGFSGIEMTWRKICGIGDVSDLKTITRYRLTGSGQFIKVPPGGTLKHGTLGEESYAQKADTYGLILKLTREDIINDDMGALTQLPAKLGRGWLLKLNDVFWTIFCANTDFFKADNDNYAEGAGTAFDYGSLEQADQLFADQTDKDSKPLGIMPKILLTPTALYRNAKRKIESPEQRDTTASTRDGTANAFAGEFQVLTSQYLGNANYGNSQKKWYLLADPAVLPTIEVAFLNGQEQPTIEQTTADFDELGVQMRGYGDFGVALANPEGGVAMKGEA